MTNPADPARSVRRIHLIAICGTGMGSLAGMLKASGYQVTGSDDQIYPPMSLVLENLEIEVFKGYSPEHIHPATDLVIIGNAVSRNNPEVQAVLDGQIPYLSFPQALGRFFLDGKKPVVVAGTHGKTTTSSLAAWTLESAGLKPGFLIGGFVKNFGGGHRIGEGPYFVVEGDEYDTAFFDKGPKFLHYRPFFSIVTGIEFDHGDIYRDIGQIRDAFRKFVKLIPPEGYLIASGDDPQVASLIQGLPCQVETYGTGRGNDWNVREIRRSDAHGEIGFDVWHQGRFFDSFRLSLIGNHNVRNALSVVGLAHHLQIPNPDIRRALQTFSGVRRRQEIVGDVNGVLVIDDFAHHPTAIHETLLAIKLRFPERRLWAVFEPRSATSRRNFFQKEFSRCFDAADRVILSFPPAMEKIPEAERLDPERLAREIAEGGPPARLYRNADEIVSGILPEVRSGDLICVMSSGGFDGIHGKLLRELQSRT